jgi:Ca2+-binding RTX toxin-like protein
MNPLSSIRRVALGAAVAGVAIAAVPALASASPCTYNPTQKTASVVDSSGVSQLRVGVNGTTIFTRYGGNAPLNCVGGGTVATTTNTDRISVFAQAKGASDGVVLDQAGGAFAPGATPEADGNSEIELALSGQSGHLSVFGTPGNDVMRVSGPFRAPSVSFLDFGADEDDDVTFAASDVSLVGGDGADFLSGQGYGQLRDATTLPLAFSGGAGDDVIEGGVAVDHFSGNAGNDTLRTNDGNPELVSGGPGVDSAVRDGADTLFDVESSVFGSGGIGRVELASRIVSARAGATTKLGVSWTHPKSWRSLKMINLKAYDGAQALGNVYVRMSDRRITGHGALALVSSSLTRQGRTASTKLAVRLPRSLAGKTLRLEVEAADRQGHLQVVSDAGVVKVAR